MTSRLFQSRLLALLLFAALPLRAQPKSPPTPEKPADAARAKDPAKAEAAERFERGLKLFNAGDNAGALAEFKRIEEILPNAIVQYNLGLVYVAMGRSVDAVDALGAAIARGGLSESDLERAERELREQRARVGRLMITTNPESALIEVDGVQVAKTPLTSPIRVSQGTHIVGAVAPGFAPARKEVVVAGDSDQALRLELLPTQMKALANYFVRTNTRGVEVLVDGKSVGTTPLSTTIGLVPGRRVITARRAGYAPIRREVDVAEGATGELRFDLKIDVPALADEGALLVLEPSESPVELTIDGERRGPYTAPVRLPRGPHRIGVAAAGFIPLELDVNLDPTVTNLVRAELEPTPETREAHESSASFHRVWGLIGVGAGVAIGGTGAALVGMGSSKLKDGRRDVADMESRLESSVPPCDFRSGFESSGGTSEVCDRARADAQGNVDSAKTLRAAGWVGVGVGGAVAVSGLVLLLTGDDPDKYDRPRPTGRNLGPRVTVAGGPGLLGAELRVAF
jgi:hypothetical protein